MSTTIFFVGNFSKEQKEKVNKHLNHLKNLYSTSSFAIVKNPENVYPEFDIYPLAPKKKLDTNFSVVLTDMDGTTTSTEILCLHSLEFMMKSISFPEFAFQKTDYPHIIGNSTTKHVEYILNKYKKIINDSLLKTASQKASQWTLKNSKDKNRKKQAKDALEIVKSNQNSKLNFTAKVKLAIEIYYARYHSILEKIKKGRGEELAKKLTQGKPLISPMPGIPLFLALLKGLLKTPPKNFPEKKQNKLKKLISFFTKKKIKIGLVTSSIFYEADIVLAEVFRKIREEIKGWEINEKEKSFILEKFSSYKKYYDTVVTADNSHEIRLKPHRDLYSIALFNLNVNKENLDKVIGFEDSTSGVIALKAAGVQKVIAVPFKESSTHDLSPASLICKKGTEEFLFKHLVDLL